MTDSIEQAPAVAAPEVSTQPNRFAALGLAPELVQAVTDLGYTEPTAVQAQAIPLTMGSDAGSDIGSDADGNAKGSSKAAPQ